MPISIIRAAPPALDRSLVPYTVNMINRICDGLLKAFGGDYQTGTTTGPGNGLASTGFNVVFPAAFSHTDPPICVVTPINTTNEQWRCSIGMATTTFFACWGLTVGGTPSTSDLTVKWVAWYP